ncbi:hypothetical protein [Rhodococcus sp. I2R]|uniref:hypothetical protein n=1 Tax=Rhodococcus sp. I2R TaxID=2855445 RepID=UPI001E57C65D|nr:hypothetical protein [Rhodococcus sp. I2R]MCC8928965.1 hypothetical protein [Rhodococcus sp. I2R]
MLLVSASGITLAGALSLAMAFSGVKDKDWGIALGGAAFGLGMLLLSSTVFALAGIQLRRPWRKVKLIIDEHRGPGLQLRRRLTGLLLAAFLAMTVWAVVAVVVQFRGTSESLLPSSRNNDEGGVIVLGMTVGLILFIIVCLLQARTDVSLYPDGILRQARRRRLLRSECVEEFLRWEDIDEVKVDTHDVHTAYSTVKNPIIRLVSSSLDPSRKLERFDTEDSMALRAYELGAEPNAIMALVLWCHENLWARERLAREDARELLHAPPLRERLRLSREAVKKPQ